MTSVDPSPPGPDEPHARRPGRHLHEVRYSLPELLGELEQERNAGSFAMEKLNQAEIGKMFENKRKRRAKKA
jgi:hypothetical protein